MWCVTVGQGIIVFDSDLGKLQESRKKDADNNVKYYRKMSNQILADETRQARHKMSLKILGCLDGWEEEYEQIRQNDRLK